MDDQSRTRTSSLHSCSPPSQPSSDPSNRPRTTPPISMSQAKPTSSETKPSSPASKGDRSGPSIDEEARNCLTLKSGSARFGLSLSPQPCPVPRRPSRTADSTSELLDPGRSAPHATAIFQIRMEPKIRLLTHPPRHRSRRHGTHTRHARGCLGSTAEDEQPRRSETPEASAIAHHHETRTSRRFREETEEPTQLGDPQAQPRQAQAAHQG